MIFTLAQLIYAAYKDYKHESFNGKELALIGVLGILGGLVLFNLTTFMIITLFTVILFPFSDRDKLNSQSCPPPDCAGQCSRGR